MSAGVHAKMSAFHRRNAITSSRSVLVSEPPIYMHFFGSFGFSGIRSVVSPDCACYKTNAGSLSRPYSRPSLVVNATVQNECGYNKGIRMGGNYMCEIAVTKINVIVCSALLSPSLLLLVIRRVLNRPGGDHVDHYCRNLVL
ncbi:hypothetical protein Nepgr_023420 [Nepenthes gracilis]|uniref:Uncharacterized protein n=1 Tax=Nepenthes gracilis TaxID=150966 RepID=A0AAD3T211_NEPGR|nr:hypothetical protein Nepgr_023420 [Nepenthes gracilis]